MADESSEPQLSAVKKELFRLWLKERQSRERRVGPRSQANDLPLSYAQQRLYFLDQLEPQNSDYHLPACIRIALLLDLISVDYVSRAIIYLSHLPLSLNKAFHLFNTQPLSCNALVSWMSENGYSIRSLPYPQWYAELRHAVEEADGNALSPFFSMFPDLGDASVIAQSPMVQSPQAEPFDTRNTLNVLANTSITCPSLDSRLLTTYFAHFVRSGFLPAPEGGRTFDTSSKVAYQGISSS